MSVVVKVPPHVAAMNGRPPVRNTGSEPLRIRIPLAVLTDTVAADRPKLMNALAVPSFDTRTQPGTMFAVEVVPIVVVTVCPTATTTREIVAGAAPPTVTACERPIGWKAKLEATSGSPAQA